MRARWILAGLIVFTALGQWREDGFCAVDRGSLPNADERPGLMVQAKGVEVGKPDHQLVLSMLFPETSDWKPVESMTELHRSDLDLIEGRLRDAFRENKANRVQERFSLCSIIDGIFDPRNEHERCFFRIDVDADGIDDVIYSGFSFCGESAASIIWYGKGNGFEVRQGFVWPCLILRIKSGNPARIGSVAVGCCDSYYDEYAAGTADNYRIWHDPGQPFALEYRPRTIMKYTSIPKVLCEPIRFEISRQDMALRSSPEIHDAWAGEDAGEYLLNAVFGNILSKYMSGCKKGWIIGKNKEAGPDLWYFVLMEGCEPYRIHSPYEVSVGWVQASDIDLLE